MYFLKWLRQPTYFPREHLSSCAIENDYLTQFFFCSESRRLFSGGNLSSKVLFYSRSYPSLPNTSQSIDRPFCNTYIKSPSPVFCGSKMVSEMFRRYARVLRRWVKGAAPLCYISVWEPKFGGFIWSWEALLGCIGRKASGILANNIFRVVLYRVYNFRVAFSRINIFRLFRPTTY